MSTSPPTDDAVAHVVRCLRLNPMWQADQVLASRAKLHGVDAATLNPQQAALDERARKAALRNKVYKLRDGAWSASPDELRRRLARLSMEGEPELAKLADRLRVIIESRAKLPQLTEHRDFDGDFLDCFQQVLTGSVRQSAEMRERVTASFQDRRLKKRGMRMIKLLRREVPQLAGLEADWLERLARQRGSSTIDAMSATRGDISESWWWPNGHIIFFLILTPPFGLLVWILVVTARLLSRLRGSR